MRRIAPALAVLVGALALPGQAAAAPSPDDVRCVALFAIKGQAAAAQSKAVDIYLAGSYYFVGRIRAQEPDVDLTQPLATAILELEGMSVELEQERCLALVQEEGRHLKQAYRGAQDQVGG